MTTIGTRIRKLREDKNISQEGMAMELLLTQSNYGRLEKNDSRLTVPKLIKIAKALGVSISYLFGEESPKNIDDEYELKNYSTIFLVNEAHIQTLKEEIIFLRKLLEVGM